MLIEIINEELPREWRFVQPLVGGLSADTQQRLRSFWATPDLAELGTEARLPHRNWHEISRCLENLVRPRLEPGKEPVWLVGQHEAPMRMNELWWRAAEKTESLAVEDPIAGSIAGLCCLARWEGVLGSSLHREYRTPAHWGLSDGWRHFPLIAARNLLRADAIWTARRLAREARQTIEGSERFIVGRTEGLRGGRAMPGGEAWWQAAADYDAVLSDVNKRHAACIDDFAWDLRDSCSPHAPSFRAEVSALFWTLGDVPHAHMLRETDTMPSREALAGLIHRSLQMIPSDHCIQWVWLMMRDRPPFSLRDHPQIFTSINARWPPSNDSLAEPVPTGAQLVSKAHAEAAVAYFRHELDTGAVRRLIHAYRLNKMTFAARSPEAFVRLSSLLTVLGSNVETRLAGDETWAELAESACKIVEAREKAHQRDPYDRILDIPFYYLPRNSPADLHRAIELTERYRAAAMWFWRRVVAPVESGMGYKARRLAAEERQLAEQLRGARFIRLLPLLPSGYSRIDLQQGDRLMATVDIDVTLRERILDSDTIAELADRIDDLARRIVKSRPEQSAARLTTHTGLDTFAAALTPVRPDRYSSSSAQRGRERTDR